MNYGAAGAASTAFNIDKYNLIKLGGKKTSSLLQRAFILIKEGAVNAITI